VKKVDYKSRRKYIGTDRYREQLPKQNSKGSASKRNNEQMGLHQTKQLLHREGNNHQIQETATELERTFTSSSSDKGNISRIYRELKKLKPQRINAPVKKWVHELNREFPKEEVQMDSKYMKKCSTSLVIKEMQIKVTLRFHLSPVRIAIIKGNNNHKCWRGCSETGTLIYCWWECKLAQPLWKAVWSFLKNLEIVLPFDPMTPLLGIYPKEYETGCSRDTCTPMFITALFIIVKL
jgi:hypothetical protein